MNQLPEQQQWRPRRPLAGYGLSAIACAVTTIAVLPLRPFLDLANIVMLFLLTVFLLATLLGRGPAVMAAFLSVALFDFFFVPPHLSFDVADAQYLVTFAVMLAVGLITTHLASRLKEQTEQALQAEEVTKNLYELACQIAGAHTLEQVSESASQYLASHGLVASVLVAAADGALAMQPHGEHAFGSLERGFAQSAFERNEIVEVDSLAGMGIAVVFIPLRAPTRVRGVLAITPSTDDTTVLRSLRQALEAIASLVALAVERLHYAEATQRADIQIAEERLRTSVLASLSHDLRTPLTTLVGLADLLVQEPTSLTPENAETARIIRDQAQAMHRLLSNLLDMARLQGKGAVLRREWQPFDEIVGSSLRMVAPTLGTRKVTTDIPVGVPLVSFDAVLMERVLTNLFENAVKYSPDGSSIELNVRVEGASLSVSVSNAGDGFPADGMDQVFDLFVRCKSESNIPGVGLGLAICKAIVVAHDGTIGARNRTGGCCVTFTIPMGIPPAIEEEVA
jgi:two-component system sensor histidine kinase KdpD